MTGPGVVGGRQSWLRLLWRSFSHGAWHIVRHHQMQARRITFLIGAGLTIAILAALSVSTSERATDLDSPAGPQAEPAPGDLQRSTLTGVPWLGGVRASPSSYDDLRAVGADRVVLEVAWEFFEPQAGAISSTYLEDVRRRHADVIAAGLRPILDVGLQYPPAWVFSLTTSARFVDQHGQVWHGETGENVSNAVFDLEVRAAQAAYLASLGRVLGDLKFDAVRAGGLLDGELRLPDPGPGTNSFWAFDDAARASSPVPDWSPGTGTEEEARLFLDWYLGSVTQYGTWLIDATSTAFPGRTIHVLFPSWGIRPGEITDALRGRLGGKSEGERRRTIQMGLDWQRQVAVLAGRPGTVAHTTWLDAEDLAADNANIAPVAYLAQVASPLGVPISGENTGGNDAEAFWRCVASVQRLGMLGMLWFEADEMFDGGAGLSALDVGAAAYLLAQSG